MKNSITKVEIDHHDPTVIIINGEKFRQVKQTLKKIDKVQHLDKFIYKKVDEQDYKNNMEFLVKELAKKTTTKELLREIIKNQISVQHLKRLVNQIKKKKPIKKHHGCLGFKIGREYLQVVD